MEQITRDPYLELLKNTLTYSLWDEPPKPCSYEVPGKNPLKKYFFRKFMKSLKKGRIQLVKPVPITSYQRDNGMIWPGNADTMVGRKRLNNLQYCIENVLADKVDGDLIEAGVWRGGSSIFMRAVLAAYGNTDKKVFVADSFEGLPKPEESRYPADSGDELHTYDYLAVSLDEVKNNFRRYQLLDDNVVFIKGWFKDSLREAPIDKISVLRADGDMYSSTIDILNYLYPKLEPGGFCIIDDYGALKPCRQAVDDYREANMITESLVEIDWTGRYWRKKF